MDSGDDTGVAELAQRAPRSSRREISAIGFLVGAVTVWSLMIGVTFAVVYFFVADREPEVLAYREVNIELSDYEITPDQIDVAPSTQLTLLVSNVGDAQHNLQISDDVGTARLKTGESATLDGGVAKTSYLIWCSVKGHRELGMEARIVVHRDGSLPPEVEY